MEYGLRALIGAVDGLPDQDAIDDGAGTYGFEELGREARRRAFYIAQKTPVGGLVGLELSPGKDWAAAFFGCLIAGRVAVPLEPRLDAATLSALKQRCDFVVDQNHSSADEWASENLPDAHAPAVLLLTSGTSGSRSEVVLSHGNLWAHAIASGEALGLGPSDRWLSALPLTHAGGIGVLIRCLQWGAAAVLRSKWDGPEEISLLSDSSENITLASLVPTTLARLLEGGLEDPPALRRAIIGGAPLSSELRSRALANGIPVFESWGLTQTCGMVTLQGTTSGSGVGTPIDGLEVQATEEGELLVRGATVSSGCLASDGWLHTGDVGRVENREVFVEGRLSSIVITGGENVMPERVEGELARHPSVRAALAYGIDDDQWGQRLVVDVVAGSDAADETELLAFLRERLAAFEVPKEVRFVESIPSGPTGKPIRNQPNGRVDV